MQQTGAKTLAEAVFPRTGVRQRVLPRDVGLVLWFTVMMTLLARVRIPQPFTPVPITGQTLGVMLTGAAPGSRRGAAAMALPGYGQRGRYGFRRVGQRPSSWPGPSCRA